MQQIHLYIFFTLFFFTRGMAQVNTFSTIEKGIFTNSILEGKNSIFFNPAGLASSESNYVSIDYTTRFNLKDLQSINAGLIYKIKGSTFGIGLSQFGNTNYRQRKVSLNYGKRLFEKLNLGVRLNAEQFHVIEFEDKFNISFDIGISSHLTETVLIAFYTTNPLLTKLGESYSAFDFNLGVKWCPTNRSSISFELTKNNTYKPIDIKVGFNYSIKDNLDLFSGFSSGREQLGFGIKYNVKNIDFSISTNYSFNLGVQSSIGIGYKL